MRNTKEDNRNKYSLCKGNRITGKIDQEKKIIDRNSTA